MHDSQTAQITLQRCAFLKRSLCHEKTADAFCPPFTIIVLLFLYSSASVRFIPDFIKCMILLEVSYCALEHPVEVIALDILVEAFADSLCVSHLSENSAVR